MLRLAVSFLMVSFALAQAADGSRIDLDPPSPAVQNHHPTTAPLIDAALAEMARSARATSQPENGTPADHSLLSSSSLDGTSAGSSGTDTADPGTIAAAADARPVDTAAPIIAADVPGGTGSSAGAVAANAPAAMAIRIVDPTPGPIASSSAVPSRVLPDVLAETPPNNDWIFGAIAAVGVLVAATSVIWFLRSRA